MAPADDTTGRGHTPRTLGNEPVTAMTIRLPKDNPLLPKMVSCAAGVTAKYRVASNLKEAGAPR